jgi:DnaK suppressor protein
MAQLSQKLIEECRATLLGTKEEILNRVREGKQGLLHGSEKSGDEADQTARILQESEFVATQERLRTQLLEIEMALARIADGTYGICDETEETIEAERLRAIPWTRLSIEGAEIRESIAKRYAKNS